MPPSHISCPPATPSLLDVYQYCAPTRGAFHTGRFPYHLDAVQKNLIPWSMPAGIDTRYHFIPAVLKRAGCEYGPAGPAGAVLRWTVRIRAAAGHVQYIACTRESELGCPL